MQLPDSVQNILAYGQGHTDGMKDGHICGFHDALVCTIHDLTALLQKYAELEKEWAASQEKAKRERLENMPQMEQPAEQKHGRWKKKNGEIYCTNCKKSKWSESFELMLRGFDFCPKCGAQMDGKDINVITKDGGADNG